MAIGSPAPRVASKDSPRLLVNVYVLGQPSRRARRVPARVRRLRSQRMPILADQIVQISRPGGLVAVALFAERLPAQRRFDLRALRARFHLAHQLLQRLPLALGVEIRRRPPACNSAAAPRSRGRRVAPTT